nr:uncharacterized protein LOC104103813 [Nicotiana tomentosiformis]
MDKEIIAGRSLIQSDLMQLDETNGVSKFDTVDILVLEFLNSSEPIEVFEPERDLIISKTNQKEVMAGQVYKDKDTLKVVMEQYAIAERFQFRVDRSNAISYTLLCISEDSEWNFKASSINKSQMFKVRKFNNKQSCPLKDKVYEQCQATDVSYMLVWRAREKAVNFLRGVPADSYNKLPGYLYTLDMTYPGSHIIIEKSPKNEFMYLYISLYAFIKGFDYCRPIVVVDENHLKSAYTGTFVSASTLDGAVVFTRHILPLAYGVVDSENDAAWLWFFEQFKVAYGERKKMCIISYRNESIIKSVSRVYPTDEFDSLIEKVEKVDIRVKYYLLARYENWVRLHASIKRGWTMTSNIAESINSALVSARELVIYDFLEEVRKMFGSWNCSNQT